MLTRWIPVVTSLAVLGAACHHRDVRPLTQRDAVFRVDGDERDLLASSDRADDENRRRGRLFQHEELDAYLAGILARVTPPGLPETLELRVFVVRAPTINAYAQPNGSIYLHSGLLVALENETELAFVVAHELTHVLNRHALRGLRDLKNKTIATKSIMTVLSPAAYGLGGLLGGFVTNYVGSLSWAYGVNGYGREMESEADLFALELLSRAGYALDPAPATFQRLNEVEGPDGMEAVFWASHPSNTQREHDCQERIASGELAPNRGVDPGVEPFTSQMREVAMLNLRLRMRVRHFLFGLEEAERARLRFGESATLHYHTGELHRRLAADPEAAAREAAFRAGEAFEPEDVGRWAAESERHWVAAEREFLAARESAPEDARPSRGLGLLYAERGDPERARQELERYLASERVSPIDRRYVERELEKLK